MLSFPFFSQLLENPAAEVLTGGTGFVLDRPRGHTAQTLFAGLLHDQSAAPSLNLKNALPDSPPAYQPPVDVFDDLFGNAGLPVDAAPLSYSEILGNMERLGDQKAEHVVSELLSSLPGDEESLSLPTIQPGHQTISFSPSQLLFTGGPEVAEATMPSGARIPVSSLEFSSLSLLSDANNNLKTTVGNPQDKLPQQPILPTSVSHLLAARGSRPSAGSSDEMPRAESIVDATQDGAKATEKFLRVVQSADRHVLGNASSPAPMPQSLPKTLANETVQASFPIPHEETQETLVETVQYNQQRLRFVSSYVHPASDSGKASSVTLPGDFFRDGHASLTGDRKDGLNTIGKMPAADQQDGQGMQPGMGGLSHSQPGFQQSSSSLSQGPGPGPGARMAEEGVPNLPSPALQRLQLDVQLSETNRVQIDVGVQQRHVYAGLVMDQATLKNLAVQFIPQLEAQLAQKNMELQEFSAEVRDYHDDEQKPDDHASLADMPGEGRRGATPLHASEPHTYGVMQGATSGLHLVA